MRPATPAERIAVYSGILLFCLLSWIVAGRFMAKCAADIRLSENMGRVATALEAHLRKEPSLADVGCVKIGPRDIACRKGL